MEPGALLEVNVEGLRGLSRTLVGRVVYCTPQDGGEWVAGCELTEELSCQALLV